MQKKFIIAKPANTPGPVQFLDIKELNDLQAEYRARLRSLIATHKKIRAGQPGLLRPVYISHDWLILRLQIHSLWKSYRAVGSRASAMTALYMEQLSTGTYRASPPTEKDYRAAA